MSLDKIIDDIYINIRKENNKFYGLTESISSNYFKTMSEIYWIYLIILIRVYNDNLKESYIEKIEYDIKENIKMYDDETLTRNKDNNKNISNIENASKIFLILTM